MLSPPQLPPAAPARLPLAEPAGANETVAADCAEAECTLHAALRRARGAAANATVHIRLEAHASYNVSNEEGWPFD